MIPFDFQLRTRLVFGPGTVESLGELARELSARRVLVVSDPGVIAAGHTGRAVAALSKASIETRVFDEVHENPTTDDVERGAAVAREFSPDLIVGLGGGSSMDCAKGINFLVTNGGRMQDYWGIGKATRPMLPMIGVPTTAGTGSETQSFALISDATTHVKMACGDEKASFRVAVLDPELTLTQPRKVTALTGIDALAHAVETFVTRPRNSISLAFSREAWRLLAGNFQRVLDEPDNLEARGAMQLGACLAGLAIENSMLGAAHALANPLTARYGIVHGQAIGLMLPHVIRFNGQAHPRWYHDLLETALLAVSGQDGAETLESANGDAHYDVRESPKLLAEFVAALVRKAEMPTRLSECGVEREALPTLAAEAAKQWTGTFNPRPVGQDELLSIYREAF
jgi:alcohol dehydrogenase